MFDARNAEPFSYATKRGRVQVRTCYVAPDGVLDDPDELAAWARQALDVTRKKA